MFGMYVSTAHSAYEIGKKTASAAVARMHVKAYDTNAVPQNQNGRAIFLDNVFHIQPANIAKVESRIKINFAFAFGFCYIRMFILI